MGWLSWILFGLLAGAMRRRAGKHKIGCLPTLAVGIVGADRRPHRPVVLGHKVHFGFSLGPFVLAVLGAIVLCSRSRRCPAVGTEPPGLERGLCARYFAGRERRQWRRGLATRRLRTQTSTSEESASLDALHHCRLIDPLEHGAQIARSFDDPLLDRISANVVSGSMRSHSSRPTDRLRLTTSA